MTVDRTNNPLVFTKKFLNGHVVVTIRVTGLNRDRVTVAIAIVNEEVWDGAMDQGSPEVSLGRDLILGEVTVHKGAVFTLRIPTPEQNGNVMVTNLKAKHGESRLEYTGRVASWTLTGALRDD